MATRIVFPSANQVAYESFETPSLGEGDVLVHTECSLMSTGTENIVYNRWFDPGTHWDNWVKYPFNPGYSAVGHVTAIGSGVTLHKLGDRVVCRGGHASDHVMHETACYPVPCDLDSEEVSWFALAKIGAMGARVAEYRLADSVLIVGAGPIGQVSIRWAFSAGATNIIVVDSVPDRLELAISGGATHTIAKPIAEAIEDIPALNNGQLTRVVVDTTGHAAVFPYALAAAAMRGRVVLLGDTGCPAQQHLSSDMMGKGLTIIGAHDSHEDALWNSTIIIKAFFELARSGRFKLKGLNSHHFAPKDCLDAYTLATTRRGETMGILFDWSKA